MRREIVTAVALLGVVITIGSCASSPAASEPPPAPVASPTPASTPSTTPAPVPTSADSPVPSPSPSGPSVVESGVYPYRITLDGGPVVFDPTRVQWDGEQRLRRDSPSVDFVRSPDGTAAWIVMTDTTLDADAYAADLAEKMRTWNGCAAPTGFTPFEAGGRPGVAFIQACGPGGAEVFTRGVVVGDGQALFAFSDGRAGASAIDGLIALLQGVEFTGPSGS